jgi:uncharacterized membrane protein
MVNVTSGNSTDSSGSRPVRHRPGLAGLRPRRGFELHPGVRSNDRLSRGERAADLARDGLGSWIFAAAGGVLVIVGIVMAVRWDEDVGLVPTLLVVLSGLALVELSLVLMAARRAARTAGEVALYDLESDRRAAAAVEELRDEVERLRGDLARLIARLQTSGQQLDGAKGHR